VELGFGPERRAVPSPFGEVCSHDVDERRGRRAAQVQAEVEGWKPASWPPLPAPRRSRPEPAGHRGAHSGFALAVQGCRQGCGAALTAEEVPRTAFGY